MELTVLGSGTVAPSPTRTAPAHWVEAGDVMLLLDCGSGTLLRSAQHGVPWHAVTHLAITHFHPDHWGELPLFIYALIWGIEPARTESLTVMGPVGMSTRLGHLAAAMGESVTDPKSFPLEVLEVRPGESHRISPEVILGVGKSNHTDESVAYAVEHHETRLVYTGDTGPSSELADWAAPCDLLLTECSLPADRMIEVHLTPAQAGQLARDARARELVLTHFYPPVEQTDILGEVSRHFSGPVSLASDGMKFRIGR